MWEGRGASEAKKDAPSSFDNARVQVGKGRVAKAVLRVQRLGQDLDEVVGQADVGRLATLDADRRAKGEARRVFAVRGVFEWWLVLLCCLEKRGV